MATLSLFSDAETFQTSRPVRVITDEQKSKLLSDMADSFNQYGLCYCSKSRCIQDLEALFPFSNSGWELAKELEDISNANYHFNAELVELLDSLDSQLYAVYDENEKTWVAAYNPQPQYQIGDELVFKKSLSRSILKDTPVYVNGFVNEMAKYILSSDKNAKLGTGSLISYEDVEQNIIENLPLK